MNTRAESANLMCYRFDCPMMVLSFRHKHQPAVIIPAGETFEVVGPGQDNRFVVANVRDEPFLVFDSDLQSRGKLVPRRRAAA